MGGTRGYSNYRGRRSRGRTALAVLLVLVILAAGAVLLLQRNIVYDETGSPRLVVPWAETAEPEREAPTLDLIVQPPRTPDLRGVYLPAGPLTAALWADTAETDALAVTLKDGTGAVYFEAASALPGSAVLTAETADALAELTGGDRRSAAVLSCFRDPIAAAADPEGMGLETVNGYLFYDKSNHRWLDPAKPAARQYVCALAAEAAALGFDELLLTDVGFPADGRLEQLPYSPEEKQAALCAFLTELGEAVEPYGTVIAVETTAEVLSGGADEATGQTLMDLTAAADRLCVRTDPAEAERLAASVRQVEGVSLLPLFPAEDPTWTGSCLVLQ